MKSLKFCCLAATLILSGTLSASETRQDFSTKLLGWLDQGFAENRSGAPQEDIASCKRAIKEQLTDIAPSLRGVSLPTDHDFAVYVTSSPGWGSIHVIALSIGATAATLSYSEGDAPKAARITRSEASSIRHVLKDMSPYRFGYTPGWRDGECGLFVMRLDGARTIALLPPGGRIDSVKGDLIRTFMDWAEPHLPEEKDD